MATQIPQRRHRRRRLAPAFASAARSARSGVFTLERLKGRGVWLLIMPVMGYQQSAEDCEPGIPFAESWWRKAESPKPRAESRWLKAEG
jgi:hypothetical protein